MKRNLVGQIMWNCRRSCHEISFKRNSNQPANRIRQHLDLISIYMFYRKIDRRQGLYMYMDITPFQKLSPSHRKPWCHDFSITRKGVKPKKTPTSMKNTKLN